MLTKLHIAAGTLAILMFATDQGMAQTSEGVTGHTPPPNARTRPSPSEPGRSRLPLIDPSVYPPGGTNSSQEPPKGEPGAAAPGQTGRIGK